MVENIISRENYLLIIIQQETQFKLKSNIIAILENFVFIFARMQFSIVIVYRQVISICIEIILMPRRLHPTADGCLWHPAFER